jgi:hypothetical protein
MQARIEASGRNVFSNASCRLLALAAFLATPGIALGCTSEDATAKRLQLSARIQSVMIQEPARGQAVVQMLQVQMAADRQDSRELNWDIVCAQYDALLKQAR